MKQFWCCGFGYRDRSMYGLRLVPILAMLLLFGTSAEGQAISGEAKSPNGSSLPKFSSGIDEAQKAESSKDWKKAEEIYSKVLEQDPTSYPALMGRGVALAMLHRFKEARKDFDEGLKIESSPESLANIGDLLGEGSLEVGQQYLERALDRAVQEGYPKSSNYQKCRLSAMLALQLQRQPLLGEAMATLRRDHPDKLETHYIAAMVALIGRDWVTAEDEIIAARKLGLPANVANQLLTPAVRQRATFWRWITYSFYGLLFVVSGLVFLFLAGKILSALILKSAERGDPNDVVTPTQRWLRAIYRVVINLAGVYYYICIPFVIVMALAIVAALGFAILHLPRIPFKLVALVVCFGFAMLMTIWSSLRSLFVRLKDEPPGRPLTVEEAPILWALLRDVADRVGTRPVDEVWLTNGTELAVFERGSRWQKMRDRGRRALILGSEVLPGFRVDAFRSVLAHEYGHFIHRDTAGGEVALRVNATMGQFATALAKQGNIGWWNLGWHFLRIYHFIFRRITHGASRLHEINADRVAARLYGPAAFETGLRHVIRRGISSQADASLAVQRQGFLSTEGRGGMGSGLDDSSDRYARAAIRRQIQPAIETAWSAGTTEDDTHPQPAERIQLISRVVPTKPGPDSGGPGDGTEATVEELFADPMQIRADREQEFSEQVKTYLTGRQEMLDAILQQLDAYIAQHPGLSEPLVQRGLVRFELRRFADAVTDFTEALRLDTIQKDVCQYHRALAWAELGEVDKAAADLETWAAQHHEEEAAARVAVCDIHRRVGRIEAAVTELDRAIELKPLEPEYHLRRGDILARRGENAAAEAEYDKTLELDSECAEAMAGRAVVRSALGRPTEASADARTALAIEPLLGAETPELLPLSQAG